MKKIYSAILASLLCTITWAGGPINYEVYVETSCQNVTDLSTDISGGVHNVNATIGELVVVKFYFKNTSFATKDVAVSRKKICVPNEWSDGLCWGPTCTDPLFQGGCYTPLQMTTNPWSSPYVTIQSDSLGELISDVHADVTLGGGHYRYYFTTASEILDSVDLKINGGCTLGMTEYGKEVGISVYPNPANNQLTISSFGFSTVAELRLSDVSGKIVHQDLLESLSTIQTRNLNDGVYILSVIENGVLVQTRKIIVNHSN